MRKTTLLILWADEAQRFMTASEDGTSDYNCVDVIREAGITVVAAAQSTTSLYSTARQRQIKSPDFESSQSDDFPAPLTKQMRFNASLISLAKSGL